MNRLVSAALAYFGFTDHGWFELLRAERNLDEVNFRSRAGSADPIRGIMRTEPAAASGQEELD